MKTVKITIWRGCATVDFVPKGVEVVITDEDTGETDTHLPTQTLREMREDLEVKEKNALATLLSMAAKQMP